MRSSKPKLFLEDKSGSRKDAANKTLSKPCILLFSFFQANVPLTPIIIKAQYLPRGLSEFNLIEFGRLENE